MGEDAERIQDKKSPLISQRAFCCFGAEGENRTRTGCRPPPPQDGVSTNSTTSALRKIFLSLNAKQVNKNFCLFG